MYADNYDALVVSRGIGRNVRRAVNQVDICFHGKKGSLNLSVYQAAVSVATVQISANSKWAPFKIPSRHKGKCGEVKEYIKSLHVNLEEYCQSESKPSRGDSDVPKKYGELLYTGVTTWDYLDQLIERHFGSVVEPDSERPASTLCLYLQIWTEVFIKTWITA